MAYQVLARKWRPKTFHELAGQEHVQRALINALDHNRLHHAYLFTGTRGVGKTTIARILARCLNCEIGVSSQPCGTCSSCAEINEGRFIDLIEIDAASHTGVDDVRDMIDNAQYLPTRGRYKVYLIDEVHMLSKSAFNALLKTLEEPPPHVKFLLATTDPQKLPATVLSRCLQFNLKNLNVERIIEHLRHVLTQEVLQFDESALWQIARAADGSMRDALSLTDQAIAFGNGTLLDADVRNMLGTIDQRFIYRMIEALATADGTALLNAVADVAEHNPNYSNALNELNALLHRIAIAQIVPNAADNSYGDREQALAYAQQLTAEDVQLYYQIGIQGRTDLLMAPDLRAGLEMVLLRMLAFRPAVVGVATNSIATTSVTGGPTPAKKPEAAAKAASVAAPPVAPVIAPVIAPAPPAPTPVSTTPAPAVQTTSPDTLQPQQWHGVYKALQLSGVIANTAAHCVLQRMENNTLHLLLDERYSSLFQPDHQSRLAKELTTHFGKEIQVAITHGVPTHDTPAIIDERLTAKQQRTALEAFSNHPQISKLTQQFSATIVPHSVKARSTQDTP